MVEAWAVGNTKVIAVKIMANLKKAAVIQVQI